MPYGQHNEDAQPRPKNHKAPNMGSTQKVDVRLRITIRPHIFREMQTYQLHACIRRLEDGKEKKIELVKRYVKGEKADVKTEVGQPLNFRSPGQQLRLSICNLEHAMT